MVNDVKDFLLLGESIDNSPGEVLDKVRFIVSELKMYKNTNGPL